MMKFRFAPKHPEGSKTPVLKLKNLRHIFVTVQDDVDLGSCDLAAIGLVGGPKRVETRHRLGSPPRIYTGDDSTDSAYFATDPRRATSRGALKLNDPRQSRGLNFVSPSKGPVKSRLKAANSPTVCSTAPQFFVRRYFGTDTA